MCPLEDVQTIVKGKCASKYKLKTIRSDSTHDTFSCIIKYRLRLKCQKATSYYTIKIFKLKDSAIFFQSENPCKTTGLFIFSKYIYAFISASKFFGYELLGTSFRSCGGGLVTYFQFGRSGRFH